jgi:hypothetical protein
MNCSSSARNRGNGKFAATSLPPPILPQPNNACFVKRSKGGRREKRFRSGEQWTVVSPEPGGSVLEQAGKFNVYKACELQLAVGDQNRVTSHLGARVRSSCRFSFAARPSRPAPVASNTPSSKDSDCIDCSSLEKTDTKNCLRCGISDWLRRLHIDEAESFRTRLDDGRRDPVCYSAYFADIVSSSRHQPTSSTKDELASGA